MVQLTKSVSKFTPKQLYEIDPWTTGMKEESVVLKYKTSVLYHKPVITVIQNQTDSPLVCKPAIEVIVYTQTELGEYKYWHDFIT